MHIIIIISHKGAIHMMPEWENIKEIENAEIENVE